MKANNAFKNNEEAVSPVIGVILMVAITVVLAAVVFVLVSDLGGDSESAPSLSFQKDTAGQDLTVIKVSNGPIAWSELTVSGCTAVPTTGNVGAGDVIGTCSGDVTIVHDPTDTLLYSTTF
ncbi:MAG: type IV pilin [Thermoplasmatota archaeon]